jgi:hypothetical protein
MARAYVAVALVALFAFAGVTRAQQMRPTTGAVARPDTASLQVQFDNRGTKVEGKRDVLIKAVASMMKVPASQVSMNVLGQSSLLNHQSVATFTATGPTTNGKSVYQNCAESVRNGWFTKSAAAKQLAKASDTWWPMDSVKVQGKPTCSAPGQKQVSGRKML